MGANFRRHQPLAGTLVVLMLLAWSPLSAQQDSTLVKQKVAADTLVQENPTEPLKTEEVKEQDKADFPLDNFYAEIKKRPLSILRNFRFSLSTGYGNTFFSHEISGYGVYQDPALGPSIFPGTATGSRYSNWVNERMLVTSAVDPAGFLVNSDTTKLGFRGNAMNIPLKATIHFEIKNKYRIGLGYSYEYMSIGALSPISYSDQIGSMNPSNPSGFMSKYFGMLGYSFYRTGNYLFTGDIQVGGFSPGSNFDGSIKTSININGGVTIERELSEYLRLFVRPSYEIKSYELDLPEGGGSIKHQMNALYINVGITSRIPDLPKCYNKDCRIQINHAHGNMEYRSRVHPIYKKQNPNYGENHPDLIKYKGKNKKKLNPY